MGETTLCVMPFMTHVSMEWIGLIYAWVWLRMTHIHSHSHLMLNSILFLLYSFIMEVVFTFLAHFRFCHWMTNRDRGWKEEYETEAPGKDNSLNKRLSLLVFCELDFAIFFEIHFIICERLLFADSREWQDCVKECWSEGVKKERNTLERNERFRRNQV